MNKISSMIDLSEAIKEAAVGRRAAAAEQVDCELCGVKTHCCGTKRCDRCWELERRIQNDPELAAKILASLPDRVERYRLESDAPGSCGQLVLVLTEAQATCIADVVLKWNEANPFHAQPTLTLTKVGS